MDPMSYPGRCGEQALQAYNVVAQSARSEWLDVEFLRPWRQGTKSKFEALTHRDAWESQHSHCRSSHGRAPNSWSPTSIMPPPRYTSGVCNQTGEILANQWRDASTVSAIFFLSGHDSTVGAATSTLVSVVAWQWADVAHCHARSSGGRTKTYVSYQQYRTEVCICYYES